MFVIKSAARVSLSGAAFALTTLMPKIHPTMDQFIGLVATGLKGLAGAAETASEGGTLVTREEFLAILAELNSGVGKIIKDLQDQ